ncbi:MAG: hypothetical protein mread185_000207 [Mycoplasmataceae bacterium]|nr:MAG: hypothetical protein mread185_000207 [Mycoplasmataceae bacterium]
MSEFELKVSHLRKKKTKFFNDKEPREYHSFLVNNPEIIEDEFLNFKKDKNKDHLCQIWILDDLIKETKINFGNLLQGDNDYKSIINFEESKSAKFNTNGKNWMVLKTKAYLENTIKKIGFWDNDEYFYESVKKSKKENKNPNDIGLGTKTNWEKVALFCLAIFLFFFLIFLIIKLVNKKTNKI